MPFFRVAVSFFRCLEGRKVIESVDFSGSPIDCWACEVWVGTAYEASMFLATLSAQSLPGIHLLEFRTGVQVSWTSFVFPEPFCL